VSRRRLSKFANGLGHSKTKQFEPDPFRIVNRFPTYFILLGKEGVKKKLVMLSVIRHACRGSVGHVAPMCAARWAQVGSEEVVSRMPTMRLREGVNASFGMSQGSGLCLRGFSSLPEPAELTEIHETRNFAIIGE
jgi:hypothetical protein